MTIFRLLVLFVMLITGQLADAASFSLFESKYQRLTALPSSAVEQLVNRTIDTSSYRDVAAQVIDGRQLHVLVFLFPKNTHQLDVARINVTARFEKISVVKNYQLSQEDLDQQPLLDKVSCADPTIEFIVFSPSREPISIAASALVAKHARAHGLKVASYIGDTATRQNYLNAMSCPLLKGNFYDGDGTLFLIMARDGVISVDDIHAFLNKQFRFKVVNIWVACNSFRDPMKTAMLVDAQAQKFAAGINDIDVGPSDNAAACGMMAAIDGKPMTAAFQRCYERWDSETDLWGFDGSGSDYFGY